MSNSGLFISIEGIDGAGKSTHLQTLAQALRDAGHSVCLTREPGGTPLAEAVRALVLHQPMDALTEALLVFAARRDHVQHCIAPALARGEVVLSDRFADASFAYQGGGRGVDWGCLEQLERWVQADAAAPGQELLQPALTLWFDVPPELAAQRLAGARLPDRFEAQPVDFFRAVRAAYARRAQADPARWVRIDARQDLAAVGQAALAALRTRGWLA
ncbi:MAG: dTMP kinase [Rhodoferax sp.]